jgi:hypothetical protein
MKRTKSTGTKCNSTENKTLMSQKMILFQYYTLGNNPLLKDKELTISSKQHTYKNLFANLLLYGIWVKGVWH